MPQPEEAKYLGIHPDKCLTWKTHIFTKRKALDIKLRNLHWLHIPYSKLSLENKIYIYIYLARTPEIGQGLGRILRCGARKPEQT